MELTYLHTVIALLDVANCWSICIKWITSSTSVCVIVMKKL